MCEVRSVRAIKVADLARNCKQICDEVFSGSPVVVSRPHNENVVVVAESRYLDMIKALELAERSHIMMELARSEDEANNPNTIWLSHDEAWQKIEAGV